MTVRGTLAMLAVALVTLSTGARAAGPTVGACPVFPSDNIWNTPVDGLPVDPHSDAYVASIGAGESLKADFASALYEGAPIGIPYAVVPPNQKLVPLVFSAFGEEGPAVDESDAGPYPIPLDAPIEGGPTSTDDRHVVVIQEQSCTLFELYKAVPNVGSGWVAVGGSRFDLETDALRPEGWTSADAGGLPIFPGLVRYDEIASGEIAHALRFTAPRTQQKYVWPARHFASSNRNPALPPLGQRFRLKARVDISGFSPTNQVILRALKTYGMLLADNGAAWFVSGAPDPRWDDDDLNSGLRQLTGADFEAVNSTGLMIDQDSGAAR